MVRRQRDARGVLNLLEKALVQRKGQITEPAFQSRHLRPLILRGTKYADTIKGRAGDDVIRGLGGADWMRGDEGVDELYGGGGNDTLVSGGGGNLSRTWSIAAPVKETGPRSMLKTR